MQSLATDNLWKMFSSGKVDFSTRYRFEYVDDDVAPEKAKASTIRTTLGYTTGVFHDFNARVQLKEFIPIKPVPVKKASGDMEV